MKTSYVPTITSDQLQDILYHEWDLGMVPYIAANAGTGKSEMAAAISRQYLTDRGFTVIEFRDLIENGLREGIDNPATVVDFRLGQKEGPWSFTGAVHEWTDEQGRVWQANLRPHELPLIPFIMILDEVTHAHRSFQGPMYQLLREYQVGQHFIDKGSRFVLLSNVKSDKGIDNDLAGPILARVSQYIMEPSLRATLIYGVKKNWNRGMLGFLKSFPDFLLHLNPGESTGADPRRWEFVSQVLNSAAPDSIKRLQVAAKVGTDIQSTLFGFLSVWGKMPTWKDITSDPYGCTLPDMSTAEGTGIAWLVAHVIAENVDHASWSNAFTYASRLTGEFQELAIALSVEKDDSLTRTPEYIQHTVTR